MFNGDCVSVEEIEKVLKMDDGDGCTTMKVLTRNIVHLILVKMINFMLNIL